MQVFAIAVICGALPATTAISHALPTCVQPSFSHISDALLCNNLTIPALLPAPPDTDFATISTWDTPTSATSIAMSTIKEQHPGAPTCGLGGCATRQLPKLLLFNMQVFGITVICAALPATTAISHALPTCVQPSFGHISDALPCANLTIPALLPVPPDVDFATVATWDKPMSATTIATSTIKEQHPGAPTCGLGGCATRQMPKLLLFNMQCLFEEGDEMTCVDERPFVRSDQPLATCEFRVIVDTMVLGLGRYLRLCGIDTIILRHGDDRDQAVKLAQKESRVIITCGAPYRQMKQYVARNQCFCVNNMVPAREQMKDVLKFYNVAVKEKDILTRCTECNASRFTLVPSEHMWQLQASLRGEGLAVAGGKALVRSYGPDCSIDFISCRFDNGVLVKCKDLVFEHLSHVSMFYVCVGCGKVYWDGSHHGRFKEQSWLKELISDEPLPVPESCAD